MGILRCPSPTHGKFTVLSSLAVCHCVTVNAFPPRSFFQIELPEYSSDDIMRSRLLAAVHYGMGGFLIA